MQCILVYIGNDKQLHGFSLGGIVVLLSSASVIRRLPHIAYHILRFTALRCAIKI